MNKLVWLLVLLVVLASCGGGETGSSELSLKVSGKVNKVNPGVKVYLEEIDGNSFKTVDTTQVNGNQDYVFEISISEPSFYRVNFSDQQFVNFILNDTDVTVNADGDKQIGFAEVKGSVDTDYFFEISDMREDFQRQVQDLNTQFAQARGQGKVQDALLLQQQFVGLERAFQKDLKNKKKVMPQEQN